MFIIYWRYQIEHQLEVNNQEYILKSTNSYHRRKKTPGEKKTRKLHILMIIEMVYLSIHLPPYVNYNIHGSEQHNILVYS